MDFQNPLKVCSTNAVEYTFSLFSSMTKVVCVIASLGDCWIDSRVAEIWKLARNGLEKFSSRAEFLRFRADLYSYVFSHPSDHGIKALATYDYFCNVLDGCLSTVGLKYSDFAKVWFDYCVDRFGFSSTNRSSLTALGKNVARTLYIGEPKVEGGWRKAVTFHPLHSEPCDVCRFLTTIVKKEYTGKDSLIGSSTLNKYELNPFGSVDLKGIHDYFYHRLKRHEPWSPLTCADSEVTIEPTYECLSPICPPGTDECVDEVFVDEPSALIDDPPNAVPVIVRPRVLDLTLRERSPVRKRIALENIQETPPSRRPGTPGSFRLKSARVRDVEWT